MSTFLRSTLTALLLVLVTSCSNDPEPQAPSTTTSTSPPTTVTQDPVGPPPALKITPVVQLDKPTAMAVRKDDPLLYVAEKTGRIKSIRNGVTDPSPILDISTSVSTGGEQGLLGLAFSPKKPAMYINYTDRAGDTHIVEYTLNASGVADIGSRRELLMVDQPFANHNGGQLAFGADGHLYIGLGDGGGAGDPRKNGQNLSVLLGKILRIDVEPSGALPYTIPYDNPFVKQSGARGEIWAYGLRNPWRFSFDSKEQGIWIADVGQGKWEEINHLDKDARGGQNYGWSRREGLHEQDGAKPNAAIDPIHEYGHEGGACSVTGGYVYRGTAIPDLTGRYLFGDYCNGALWTLTKRGTGWDADTLNIKLANVSSFGQDNAGEIYVLSLDGLVGRIDAA